MGRNGVFAPHTRGSTVGVAQLLTVVVVCPAHAGVYRSSIEGLPAPNRLPRTRGGLPCGFTSDNSKDLFAPHTRGSTRSMGQRVRYPGVCPAHAGVYLTSGTWRTLPLGLPRTRGGLPLTMASSMLSIEFAPHTRGSTPQLGFPS